MNGRRTGWAWALLALAMAGCTNNNAPGNSPGTAAGQESGQGSAPKLLFVTNTYSDWWKAVETGMEDGARDFGAVAEMRKNLRGETQRQVELLEEGLRLPGIKGVAVSIVDAKAPGVTDVLRRLKDAGKVIITIDSDVAPESADLRRAYIGTNNREAGQVAGKAAAALRPEGGKVAVFVGIPSAANAVERREGFFEGAGPKFEQVEVFADKVDKKAALDNVQVATSKYRDLGVLLGLWSYNAPAIAEVVAGSPELRKQVTVVTFDLDANAIPQVEEGQIDATVCQNPYEIGYQAVRLLKALIEKDQGVIDEMLPAGASTINTGVRVVVPGAGSPVKGENVMDVGAMKKWLATKGLKST